jgi:hypothetical protein
MGLFLVSSVNAKKSGFNWNSSPKIVYKKLAFPTAVID